MSELFSELTVAGKPVKEWDMVLECGNGNYRLYTHKVESEDVLVVMALRLVNHEDKWECEEFWVEVILCTFLREGSVRYMVIAPRDLDKGYIDTPDLDAMASIFKKIKELETTS